MQPRKIRVPRFKLLAKGHFDLLVGFRYTSGWPLHPHENFQDKRQDVACQNHTTNEVFDVEVLSARSESRSMQGRVRTRIPKSSG